MEGGLGLDTPSLLGDNFTMNFKPRLVYSTDPLLNQKCMMCKELLSECTCKKQMPVDLTKTKIIGVLRIEKAGRGGKTVTVIDQLPCSESFFEGAHH
jgi:hypothetical protein